MSFRATPAGFGHLLEPGEVRGLGGRPANWLLVLRLGEKLLDLVDYLHLLFLAAGPSTAFACLRFVLLYLFRSGLAGVFDFIGHLTGIILT